jgi:hypothetical protein
MYHWGRIFDMHNKVFKSSGCLDFHGSIRTDGYSIITLLQNTATKANKRRITKDTDTEQEFEAIESRRDVLLDHMDKIVLGDPNRRSLLYLMKYTSTATEKKLLRYTHATRRVLTGQKFHRI